MTLAKDIVKRMTIALWCIGISLFLWYFALVSMVVKTEPDFFQYLNFCILLFGGGVAYHVVVELLSCPYMTENHQEWISLRWSLMKVYFGFLVAGVSLLLAKAFGGDWGLLLGLLGLIFGMLWVMHYLIELHKPITKLLNSSDKETQPTR